ncbi:MAG TPA: nuclear transport factor 2 family protein [Gemmatimonadaceae bacterium]|nr:nuclear transport factor 2 family protein [Gemmatimonadaceae bacterium]
MRFALLLLSAGATLAAAGCRTGNATLSEEDVAAIRSVGQEFTQATVEGDYDRVADLHTEDVVWMAPDAPATTGRDGLRQTLEAGPRALSFVITPAHTEGAGDIAYDRGAFTWRAMIGTDTVSASGKYVQVLRRQPDGSWLIALDIWNADEPAMPPAAAPVASRPR